VSSGAGGDKSLIPLVKKFWPEINLGIMAIAGPARVRKVRADIIRNNIWIDFIGGGNFKAYDWFPEWEIWIADDVRGSEVPAFMIHEADECVHMLDGMAYNPAHHTANKMEQIVRDDHSAFQHFWEMLTRSLSDHYDEQPGKLSEKR
jgi:hypothetical protein